MSKKDKVNLDSYHYHELTDRTWLVMEMIDAYIAVHPATTKKQKKLAHKAISNLYDLYNDVATTEMQGDINYATGEKHTKRK